jgi:threonine/homoserine/homoserine lactone efflux protein
MLYLAFGILKASYIFADRDSKPLGFTHGVMLQVLNPKLFFYAFTLFSAFLASTTGNLVLLAVAAALLAAISFGATTTWALFGAAIKSYLHQPRVKTVVNILLALLLVYAALELVGVL